MFDMALEDFYKTLEEDEINRHQSPCCANCLNYFMDYGYSGCKIYDLPLIYEDKEKCDNWK